MITKKQKFTVEMAENDYFYFKSKDGKYEMTACDKSGFPIRFSNITKKQLRNTISQITKMLLIEDENKVDQVFAKKSEQGTVFFPCSTSEYTRAE